MSDAFVYFWIIGAGLTLGVGSVLIPGFLIYQRQQAKNSKRGAR